MLFGRDKTTKVECVKYLDHYLRVSQSTQRLIEHGVVRRDVDDDGGERVATKTVGEDAR